MEVDSPIGSVLVGMDEKSGGMAEARRVFDGIIDKDIFKCHDHHAIGALELGAELDRYASIRGLYNNVYMGTALVDINEASWNTLICGLAFSGRGHDAIQQFELMRNEIGIQPNDITFIGVLSACVHVGLLDYGPCLFNSLTPMFKIIFKIKHYSCTVDL
ncbi:hypothetical protein C2845_PM01G09020 [Panicum miliaceum]|uniref:Pentatricopeptide repeat-containing protein n=1 Tax=Panicum miliaceum TaxID=4540 RepID=A0A3L6TT35_PANMI|nr:hypothetical protein C2845_PM01G09020 [Panicum miliaceum]